MTLIEAAKQALEALWMANTRQWPENKIGAAINALSAAIEQAEKQEPVACRTLCELCVKRGYDFCANAAKTTPIITTPPAAQRQPLTDEQIEPMFRAREKLESAGEKDAWYWYAWGVSDGEAAHGIKENT
jgi:hypothetical protein